MGLFCPGTIAYQPNGPAFDPVLSVIPIPGLSDRLEIALVTARDRNYPACARVFFRTVAAVLKNAPASRADLQL